MDAAHSEIRANEPERPSSASSNPLRNRTEQGGCMPGLQAVEHGWNLRPKEVPTRTGRPSVSLCSGILFPFFCPTRFERLLRTVSALW